MSDTAISPRPPDAVKTGRSAGFSPQDASPVEQRPCGLKSALKNSLMQSCLFLFELLSEHELATAGRARSPNAPHPPDHRVRSLRPARRAGPTIRFMESLLFLSELPSEHEPFSELLLIINGLRRRSMGRAMTIRCGASGRFLLGCAALSAKRRTRRTVATDAIPGRYAAVTGGSKVPNERGGAGA